MRHPASQVPRTGKICFVLPWYGAKISGGAEAECRELIQGLRTFFPGCTPEVATTTLQEFSAPWNREIHREGSFLEDGIRVHRFSPIKPSRKSFGILNRVWLSRFSSLRESRASPLSSCAEFFYLHHMIVSPRLLRFLSSHYDQYDAFLYIPYMFATSILGAQITRGKSVIIPCLHEESYAYMGVYRTLFSSASQILAHVPAEKRLLERLYPEVTSLVHLLGESLNTDPPKGNPEAFRAKYHIQGPFLLYIGRKIVGKNLPVLVDYFLQFKKFHPSSLKLVLAGQGDLEYGKHSDIVDVGFISAPEKYDALSACLAFVQPSLLESFSIVLMEAWLQGRPALVNGECEVLRDHCVESGGGLCFYGYETFESSLHELLLDLPQGVQMGVKGKRYVEENFSREKVMSLFGSFLSLGGRSPLLGPPP